ncbi:nucleoside-diphosphate sugar epimerase/dehydratase [Occultella aeris]|uniref:UDP-N-acetyl-alpha-D-glucosamine C6 dehydratase n=1 Tax=Occultella aeris TaxID=2761496 RepID=A0A7M4DJI7_9MICO|nr:nucleoside-diphosphate sugar epimerase/dehydratase [Occultella aeris]VZO37205.1 UDP-N-acetyl-alpha-D-glucosamine C6 dehydratase [Occultella aeris]
MNSVWGRRALRAVWDCFSWAAAVLLVVGARYDFTLPDDLWASVGWYVAAASVLQVGVGTVLMLYRGRYRTASFDESIGMAVTAVTVGALLAITFVVLLGSSFPRAVAVLTPPIALLFMAAGRWMYRASTSWQKNSRVRNKPVLIYGAGDAGHQLIRLIATDDATQYRVVGFIDDDKAKRNLRLLGVPVLGRREHLLDVAAKAGARTVIFAVTNADAATIREVSDLVMGGGLKFLVLPPLADLIGGRVRLSDVREIEVSDILGRRQIKTDIDSIAGYLTGRRVLITGAGGSIGSELARQVHRFGPSELTMLDRDESALHGVQLSIYGQGLLDTPDVVLCDIRDEDALRKVFAARRPEVILHTAALKHLPMLEQYPEEAWKTNVLGTLNVLRLADEYGVRQFVNISTDKAADPSSVLGHTKRIAEQLTAWQAARADGTYLSVRFGNVLGSRGSMLHTFSAQIAKGGPVTVTHPEITRYFMTIPEACELTIQAAAIGRGGEVLVLDMGEPVSILDVAKRMIAKSGKRIDIAFTGLRGGEKMHEVLIGREEADARPFHPLITHVPVPPVAPEDLPAVHSPAASSAAAEHRAR